MPLTKADARFADLLCEDPQWLRAEFDALISASFGKPPAPSARASPGPAASRLPVPAVPAPPARPRRHRCPRRQAGTPSATLTSGDRAACGSTGITLS
jgi:hypothetical protein